MPNDVKNEIFREVGCPVYSPVLLTINSTTSAISYLVQSLLVQDLLELLQEGPLQQGGRAKVSKHGEGPADLMHVSRAVMQVQIQALLTSVRILGP